MHLQPPAPPHQKTPPTPAPGTPAQHPSTLDRPGSGPVGTGAHGYPPSTKTSCGHRPQPQLLTLCFTSSAQQKEEGAWNPPATHTAFVPHPKASRQHPPAQHRDGRRGGIEPLREGTPGERQLLPGRALGDGCTPLEVRRARGRRSWGHIQAPGRRRGPGDTPRLGEGRARDKCRPRDGRVRTERGMSPGSGRGMRGRVAGMRSPKYTVLSHLGHLDAMAGEESGAEPRRAVPSRAVRPAPPGPRPLAPPPGGSGAGLPAERLPGSVRAARIGSARPPERQVHGRDPVPDKPSLLCSPSPKAQRMRVLRIPLSWGKKLKGCS